MAVTIDVSDHDALVDDVISIVIRGLTTRQAVTVHAVTVEKKLRFGSCGCFYADENGNVDLAKQASSQTGTYTGVSPMGLFWSMKSAPGERMGSRLVKSDASTPLLVQLRVCDGHFTFDELYTDVPQELASVQFRRWYMAKGVQKIKVRSGRVRGSLFLPPGPGPHRGVIDLFGSIGSIVEFRAALFASRGFATLALPYFGFDDLPSYINDLELEYFLEAIKWLSNRPEVISDHIGVIGVSKGGEIALHAAFYSPQVKAVVSINGVPFFTACPMWYQGKQIGHSEFVKDAIIPTNEGNVYKQCLLGKKENFLPIWAKDMKVMLVVGSDDQMVKPEYLTTLHNSYPVNKKHNCKLLYYPGAGHLIEPPYSQHCRSTYRPLKGYRHITGWSSCLWGGSVKEHAFAQEDSWRHILEYFRTHLSPNRQEIVNCD